MLPIGNIGPFTLVPLPLPPPVPPVVVEPGDAGNIGELPLQPTISKAAQSRSNIENFRIVCLLIHFNSSD
jgi:hypothetical protein